MVENGEASDGLEVWFARAVEASHAGRNQDAEAAFNAVLAIAPAPAEAWFGLGLSRMAERRFAEAVGPLRRAAAAPDAEPVRHLCLGQALYMTGAFAPAVEAFDLAGREAPLPANAWRTWARARTFVAILDDGAELALRQYLRLAGPEAEDVEALAQEAFAIFAGFGQIAAARVVGQWLLERRPDDPVLNYRMQVLAGEPLRAAPAAYVIAHFDAFADRFDQQLESHLGYKAPQALADLLAEHRANFATVLDLGCGTGLAAPALAGFGGRLTGVDLSSRMLEKAGERGLYDALIQAEAVSHMRSQPRRYQLIFAADVLIYLGDLEAFFAAAALALQAEGYLAISTETASTGWTLLGSGRFAHAPDYVVATAAPWFETVKQEPTVLRREGLDEVHGLLHVFRVRPDVRRF